ncbi:hypothetical protein [Crossiella sp. CA198]|uniref:hypothetical protein n=1 Tax=Crossiella sp. CA198 TaxID=3455607 RepID=UPI003F8D720A
MAVVLAVVLTTLYWPTGRPTPLSPLALQLEGLRADNGLFYRPALAASAAPSLAETAYADQVLALTGQRPPALAPGALPPTELTGAAVWNRWYLNRIARATGVPSTALAPERIRAALQPGGYLEDGAAADWSRLATTAAGLEVLADNNIPVDEPARARISGWLAARAAELTNPYQACTLRTASRALGLTEPATVRAQAESWWQRIGRSLDGLPGDEAVLDVYGFACLTGRSPQAPRLLGVLRAELGQDMDAFRAFHLAATWRELGGDAAALAPLTRLLAGRRLPNGMVAAKDRRIGTIDSALAVTEIRALAGLDGDDRLLVTGVDELAGQAELDPATLAKAALTRRATGQADSDLDRRALIALSGAVPPEISGDAAARWVNLRRLQLRLAPDLPLPRLTDWRPTGREERLTAWQVLGLTGDAAPPGLRAELATLPGLLDRDAGALSLRELRAGVQALRRNNISVPATAVQRAVAATKGCPAQPELYRPEPTATDCDLSATADALWLTANP